MVEHSIANLHLRVRAIGDAARGATAAQHARRLATAVFERAGDLLETRRPGRVIRVRRLPVRWSVDEAWLFDEKDWDALVWRLAEELADALEGQCEGAGGNDTGGDVRRRWWGRPAATPQTPGCIHPGAAPARSFNSFPIP